STHAAALPPLHQQRPRRRQRALRRGARSDQACGQDGMRTAPGGRMSPGEPGMPTRWTRVCALEDIVPETGVAALVGERQVAIFRVRDAVHAIGNRDPASGVNVLCRGLVGDVGGEAVVASPIYKQHYSLITGRCLEEPELCVPTF